MLLDPDECYQALVSHDARFDGVFFVAVGTTGIYCRPICPARTPRQENCRFFSTAAGAERAGFRPCRRCRPELAPGDSRADAVSRVAIAAAERIEAGALDEAGLEELAASFGLGSRQLRRVLRAEFGVSPVELAQTQRLLLAKRLLTDSDLPVTEVAFASGFASVRRMNALFRERYGLSPTELRRTRAAVPREDSLVFEIAFRPPFAWEPLLAFLGARGFAGVEAVLGNRYLRTAAIGAHRGWIGVEPAIGRNAVRLEVGASLAPALGAVLTRVKRLFDLNARPDRIEACLGCDARLKPLVERTPGLRVPGAFEGFELGLRAILGQQVSVRAATTLAGRLAAAFGEPLQTPFPQLTRLTPQPHRIAGAALDELTVGITRSRAVTLRALARADLLLEPGANVETTIARLTALPGVGEWTAQYVALRALHWPDAFPHTDLGIRKALGGAAPGEIRRMAESWRPWRAYAAMHLWRSLETKE